jgi:glycosyltransferase involved in cell wall biosynthesis
VGYDVHGIRDSIQDGRTGLLTAAGDPEGLAREALELISDLARYESIRGDALEWADGFSWDRTASELLAFAGAWVPNTALQRAVTG